MEAWAKEQFTANSVGQTAIVNATALGGVRVLDQLIEQIKGCQEERDSNVKFVTSGVNHG